MNLICTFDFHYPFALAAKRAGANCVVSHGSFCGRQMRERVKKELPSEHFLGIFLEINNELQ